MKHTILGSGGAIGIALAKALKSHTDDIRLVSRTPRPVHDTDELVAADLLDADATMQAVRGSSVAYLTVGFPYKLRLWQDYWPQVMRQVIDACKAADCKLVFFDNMYMYDGKSLNGMDESTKIDPPSRKGQVRALIANMVIDEVEAGKLTALIARCADYYGPSISNTSVLTETVFNNLYQGKKAFWMASADCKHSFTYVPDAGKATALLGQTDDAFNQVWHLPTAAAPPTGKQWIEMIATELGVDPRLQVVPKWMVRMMGLFNPIMREMVEMLYQYNRDYVFDSTKFEQRFNFNPTPYAQGIREIVRADYSS